MKTPLILAIGMTMLAGQALAEDWSLTVPANRTIAFGNFTANTDDCHFIGKPKMGVPKPPQHGRVDFKWAAVTVQEGRCKGKVAHLMRALYTPQKGFRGKDTMKISMTFPRYEGGGGAGGDFYNVQVVNFDVR